MPRKTSSACVKSLRSPAAPSREVPKGPLKIENVLKGLGKMSGI